MQELTSLANLEAEEIRSLWSRTYNREGKPDWSHIFPYYHEEVVFRDSIQEVRGIEEFKALCDRLTDRCEQLRMDIPSILKDGSNIFDSIPRFARRYSAFMHRKFG